MHRGTEALQIWIRQRAELVMLCSLLVGAILAAAVASDRGFMPLGVLAVGLVGGTTLALHAAGMVLVFRSNRIINFAQIPIGGLGAVVFSAVVQNRLLLVGLDRICPPCLSTPQSVGELRDAGGYGSSLLESLGLADASAGMLLRDVVDGFGEPLDPSVLAAAVAPGWLVQLNYWLSLLGAIAFTGALLWVIYALLIKRFADAPRLIVTVLTIGVGSLVSGIAAWLAGAAARFGGGSTASASVPPPFGWRVSLSPAVFSSADVLIVASGLGAAAFLVLYFRRSTAGILMRASADNPERAQTLGANLTSVAGRTWLIAGALAGAASVLSAAQLGAGSVQGMGFLVRTLGAVVVGGMVSLPLAFVGAFGIGIAEQAVMWGFRSPVLVSILVLALIVSVLLVQRARRGRPGSEDRAGWQGTREIRPVPRELRHLPVVRHTMRILGGAGLILVLGYPWFMSPAQISLAMGTMVLAMIGLSLLVLTGWAGQISLGHIAFAAIGGWVAAMVPLPFAGALLAGAASGAVAAVLVGIPAFRLRGLHLAVSTLALGVAAAALLMDERYLGRFLPDGIERPMFFGIDFEDDRSFYYFALLMLTATIVGVLGLRRSRIGRALIASRDNETAAQAYGISLLRIRSSAFAVSGFIAAGAGALLVHAERGVEALSFTPERNIEVFLMAVLGGLGSVAGPLLGALYLGLLRVASTTAFGPLIQILAAPGLGVVVLLMFLPGGLSQAVYGFRDAWLRRVASRHRIEVPSLVAHRQASGTVPLAPLRDDGDSRSVPPYYRPESQWMVEVRRLARRKERSGV